MSERSKETMAKNLNYYMESLNVSRMDIAKLCDVSKATVGHWLNAVRYPRIDKIEIMANYFGILKSDLIEEHKEKNINTNKRTVKGIIINVLGRVAAGIPLEAIEEIVDTEEISEEMAATGSFFGLRIQGDSMEPRICDGDIVIVRQQDDAESGDVVIATVNGTDATCKRLRKYRDGIELISNNPAYSPMFYSLEQVENLPVKIIGKVVEFRAKV